MHHDHTNAASERCPGGSSRRPGRTSQGTKLCSFARKIARKKTGNLPS
ncbi:hypothetical protein CPAR01_01727 [Colletotrichum paranaense]|uniref:Uncharacterized protein n=3 Tax=Colletotrichum acutatum species complex TaxID=2707335 RepID=A0AAI9UAI9_9PEZI|nr:uncharacterized protein CPAR01_01727 [Colletotrichum paranaense]XP_060376806.1 uncharacterized protein CTAM01_12526 [Colletotrichum tamarilloi]XP_060392820.1 uncharacterized protein CABS01_03526 [Colletotrichum abscissum]KAI3548076.1 hypothetical protein CSPX01_03243 [Colletotrichum filicis]KAK1454776.1 hypothetical protein CMEL01_03536 [Colletotrichum melonis]KAK1478224.1 hypothetical protein CABS01_03526 [Colletotrichum abscissum]KAK1485458.1 hypothetical protein CTAM01_12526 [Colletotri